MAKSEIMAARTYTEKPDTSLFKMHAHDGYEIFLFISGRAKYYIEGTVYSLRAGDLLLMKRAESHSLLLLKDAPYERISVHFGEDAVIGERGEQIKEYFNNIPLGQKNHYPASVFKGNNWEYYLNTIVNADDEVKRLYITTIMSEICDAAHRELSNVGKRDSISGLIEYINEHLGDGLSLESICDAFHISVSHASRRFKQMTGTSIWDYVKQKRLLLAKELLKKGMNPTRVCEKCGFNEYSSFYRAYKSKFGVSPKDDASAL